MPFHTTPRLFCALAACGLLASITAAQAQTLALTPSSVSAVIGDTITFDLTLSNFTDVSFVGTNVSINTSFLEFDAEFGGTGQPFLSDAGSPFNVVLSNEVVAGTTPTNSTIRFGAGAFAPATEAGTVTLASFRVRVVGDPGTGGTPVTLGAIGSSLFGGSEAQNATLTNVLVNVSSASVAVVPGPEALAVFGAGQFGLLLLRRRTGRRS